MTNRILLVDDELNVLAALRRVLKHIPCEHQGDRFALKVDLFSCPYDALRAIEECTYDLIISDYRMPGMDGVQLLTAARRLQPLAVRFILSGYADLQGLTAAINEARISRFIPKPWDDGEFVSAVAQGLAYRRQRVETERLADERRMERDLITAEELARRKLEAEEPGITQVHWGPDGAVILDPELQAEYERMRKST